MSELVSEWTEYMTRIGNALGLKGQFLVDFGFQQVEATARFARADSGARDIELEQTCGACPEQYSARWHGVLVGYLRLRHGYFSVRCPDSTGEVVYGNNTSGDGGFADDERDAELAIAKRAIWLWVQKNPETLERVEEARKTLGSR